MFQRASWLFLVSWSCTCCASAQADPLREEDDRAFEARQEKAIDQFLALKYELSPRKDQDASVELRKLVDRPVREVPDIVRFIKEKPPSKATTTAVLILAGRCGVPEGKAVLRSFLDNKELPRWFHLVAQETIRNWDEDPPMDESDQDFGKRMLKAWIASDELGRCRRLDQLLQTDEDFASYLTYRYGHVERSFHHVFGYFSGMSNFYICAKDFASAFRMCDEIDRLPLTSEYHKAMAQEVREQVVIAQMLHEAEAILEKDREKSIELFHKTWDRYNDFCDEAKKGPTKGIGMGTLTRLHELQREGKVPHFEFKKNR